MTIKVINAIRINMYFETTVEDFYKNDGIANFIDKVAAYLGINIWQMKIVSFSSFSNRLLEDSTGTNNNASLSELVFFLESPNSASSTEKVD